MSHTAQSWPVVVLYIPISFTAASFDVSSLSRSIHFYTRALHHIRPALMEPMAATLCASMVHCRLDYANSIMYGMSASNKHKLQFVQNSLTRVAWSCLSLSAIFHLLSDIVTSTGFQLFSEYSSQLLHLPLRS